MFCGNTVVLKASEDAPLTANFFAKLSKQANLPDGTLNIIHGNGQLSGKALVDHNMINVISFTGSSEVGKIVAEICAKSEDQVQTSHRK